MLLGGLWHGAGWPFLIWGGLHGVYLAVERARSPVRTRVVVEALPRGARQIGAAVWTFALVCLAWVFFRAPTLGDALTVLRSLADVGGGGVDAADLVVLGAMVGGMLVIDVVTRTTRAPLEVVYRRPVVVGACLGVMVLLITLFSGGTPVPFIYFQF
jgi:hypothetical protein